MEEKKRRPRVIKADSENPLQERGDTNDQQGNNFTPGVDNDNRVSGDVERRPWQEKAADGDDSGFTPRRPYQDRNQEGGYQQRPYQQRPYQDRQEGGYQQRPYQDRSQDNPEGGYQPRPYQQRPYQDRSQGNQEGGYQPRPYQQRPYQDRSQGNQEGGYQPRPYQDRSQGNQEGGYQPRPYQQRPYQDRSQGNQEGGYQPRPYQQRPYQDRSQGNQEGGYQQRPYQDRSQGGGGYQQRPYQDRSQGGGGYQQRPYQDRSQGGGGYQQRPYQDRGQGGGGYQQRPYQDRFQGGGGGGYQQQRPQRGGFGGRPQKPKRNKPQEFYVEKLPKPELPTGEGMPLNKYLAHCGISSRRKAVEFIEQGLVTVNGNVITEPYYRYQMGDLVTCEGNEVTIQERMIYVLLNKPKGVITTTDDERGRTTIMDIVDPHFPERIYPVGRLDRDTTGLILLTNDGDLAQKLTHPSHHVQKQYRIGLDQGLTREDYDRIMAGIELEDGTVLVNWIRFAEDHPMQDVVELEITMGRNRIVRRLFESLGYEVKRLDRFYFAGLTKKDLARGAFRELTQREVIMLKHFTGQPIPPRQTDSPFEESADAGEDFVEGDFTEADDNI